MSLRNHQTELAWQCALTSPPSNFFPIHPVGAAEKLVSNSPSTTVAQTVLAQGQRFPRTL